MRDEVVMGNVLRDEFVMKDHEFITIVPTVLMRIEFNCVISHHRVRADIRPTCDGMEPVSWLE